MKSFMYFLIILLFATSLYSHEIVLKNQNVKHDYSHSVTSQSTKIIFNNGSIQDYERAAGISGDTRLIQEQTEGLYPRQEDGASYFIAESNTTIKDTEKFIEITSNSIPEHTLYTNNPNCAAEQEFTFKIPKQPQFLNKPIKISEKIQEIGVALNGVVIAGPYDGDGNIAIFSRKIGQCGGHADPRGMYHYHYAPLCGETNFVESSEQIGWGFDGIKIMGLVDRTIHNEPEIDICNGHDHDGEYHYHATNDYPSYMSCFAAKPYQANFRQKRSSSAECPNSLKKVGKKNKDGKKTKKN
tara:strand:- start:1154 stop:2047 length:894 start_codon:yes stop_codon:yes gene_type:complete